MRGAVIGYFFGLAVMAPPAFTGKPLRSNVEERGDQFEGDIVLPLPRMGRSGLLDEAFRWVGGIVPFEIDPAFSVKQSNALLVSFELYKIKTDGCISFVERTDEEDYIYFRKTKKGCSSKVGKYGGKQDINLSHRCFKKKGTLMHEIMHALGFFHEQSRTDRDEHVKIITENIAYGHLGNFKKYSSTMIGPFGVDYDYNSIMHYSPYAFSRNGLKTIIAKDGDDSLMGQREDFSPGDIQKLMTMYNCIYYD